MSGKFTRYYRKLYFLGNMKFKCEAWTCLGKIIIKYSYLALKILKKLLEKMHKKCLDKVYEYGIIIYRNVSALQQPF